jgi:hypothetical protein
MNNSLDIFYNETPGMDSIVDYISAGIPVIRGMAEHQTVVDGYIIIDFDGAERHYLRIVDPAHVGHGETYWIDMPYPGSFHEATIAQFMFPPETGQPIRSDEEGVSHDSDGDGLMDFDEINRFPCDPYNDDSDFDGLTDKVDMVGCFYDREGWYWDRGRDIDGDGDPKETDPDNDNPDNMGNNDGCEDANHSGYYDPESEVETNNFIVADDFTRVNSECFMGYIRFDHSINVDISGIPGAQGFSGFQKSSWAMVIIDGDELNTDNYAHRHIWARDISGDFPSMESFGSDFGYSTAKVSLEIDPVTQEHTLYVDTLESWDDFDWTTVITPPGPMPQEVIEQVTPNRPAFDDIEIPLGVPVEERGGLVLRDQIDVTEVLAIEQGSPITSIPGVSNILSWEIWLMPPTEEH